MAEIILAPGEVFEHYHRGESVTRLMRGKIMVTIGPIVQEARRGELLTIPAATPHSMTNVGKHPAAVHCYHMPSPLPPKKPTKKP